MKPGIFLFLSVGILFGIVAGAVVKTPTWETLDQANLDTINRQTRKALLGRITDELTTAKSNLDLLQPQIQACQDKINQTLGPCSSCVNDHCKQRLDQCAVDFNLPANVGLSILGSSINGNSKVTVCSLTADNSKTCSTIMSPNQIFISSISNMGDILRVNLQSAITDLGGNIVTFIGNAQNFVKNINDTEIAAAIDDIKNQLQISLSGINHGVHSMVDGINNGLMQMTDGLASGLQMMELGLSQMVNGFNRQYMDFSSQFHNSMGVMRNDMSQLGASLGGLGNTIGNAMQNIFGPSGIGSFWGKRRRRSAILADPPLVKAANPPPQQTTTSAMTPTQKMVEITPTSNSEECLMFVENSTACNFYMDSCPSCAEVIHSTKDDIMKTVCGDAVVQKTISVKEQVQDLTDIYDQVLSARDLVAKVEFDKSSFDEITMSFKKVFITASIRGLSTRFPLTSSELTMLDLKKTGMDIAKLILEKWHATKATTVAI